MTADLGESSWRGRSWVALLALVWLSRAAAPVVLQQMQCLPRAPV